MKGNQKVTVHISYSGKMTLRSMEKSLHILNDAFATFSAEKQIALSTTDRSSPIVAKVANGSLGVDVIVPISCALLPILYDIIKNKFEGRKEFKADAYAKPARMRWSEKDTYQLSKRVLEEYVLGAGGLSISEFIDRLSLSKPYKKKIDQGKSAKHQALDRK